MIQNLLQYMHEDAAKDGGKWGVDELTKFLDKLKEHLVSLGIEPVHLKEHKTEKEKEQAKADADKDKWEIQ